MQRFLTFWTFVVIIITAFIHTHSQVFFCHPAYGCVGDTIDSGGGIIYPSGYRSTFGSNTSLTTTFDVRIRGAFGCYKIGSITSDDIFVYTENGLSHAIGPLSARTSVGCFASVSCNHISIRNASNVYCWGDQSCLNIHISSTDKIEGHGAYSLMNSIVENINTTNSATIDLNGYNAGYNLSIICRGDSTTNTTTATECTINCNGNGCNGTRLDCAGASCTVNCSGTESNPCPVNITGGGDGIFSELDILFDIGNWSLINDKICNDESSGAVARDNGTLSAVSLSETNFNDVYLCCRGSLSCANSDSINITNGNIICNAEASCENINNQAINIANGSLFCSGHNTCENSNIYADNNADFVYCGGLQSCEDVTIVGGDKVICGGYQSCKNAVISGVSDIDIYVTAWEGANGAVIYSGNKGIRMNVYLLSYESGLNVAVYCNKSDICVVHCGSRGSCDDTTLFCGRNNDCTVECDPAELIDCPLVIRNNDPTNIPSPDPTTHIFPTGAPFPAPATPTNGPTGVPSHVPSLLPSDQPSDVPVMVPTFVPTKIPTHNPSSTTTTTTTATIKTTKSIVTFSTKATTSETTSTTFVGSTTTTTTSVTEKSTTRVTSDEISTTIDAQGTTEDTGNGM